MTHFWRELECLEPRILLDSAPIVMWTALNDGNSQRSTLAKIEVGFDADVGESLSVDDLVLTHADGTVADLAGASFSYDAGARAATWDLTALPAERMPDGFYRAGLLSAGISDGDGRQLDGNRDGTGGDDYEFGLFRMSGDTNGDGSVDGLDRRAVLDNWLKPAGQFDVDADANGDGAVNVHDLLAVRRNYQRSVQPPVRLDRAQGPDELAAALLYSPEKIHEFVLNTIRYEPYAGSMKGAAATLRTGAGNAWDQSALLVETLDEAGVYARFASAQIDADPQQVMDWLGAKHPTAAGDLLETVGLNATVFWSGPGGEALAIYFDHIWVQANLPDGLGGHQWKDVDPSWKFRAFREGVPDLITRVPFDRAGYMSQPQPNLAYEYYADQVAAYLSANVPGTSLADVPYDGPIIPRQIEAIDGVLPYGLNSSLSTYNHIPSSRLHRVRLRLTDGWDWDNYFDETLVLPEMCLDRVTVSPADAGGGRVRPQLLLDGEVIAESSSTFSPADSVHLRIQHFGGAGNPGEQEYIREAGEYLAVGLDAGQISEGMIGRFQHVLNDATIAKINGEPYDRDDLIGGLLARAAMGYFHEARKGAGAIDGLTEAIGIYPRVASCVVRAPTTLIYYGSHEELQNPYVPSNLAIDIKNGVHIGFSLDHDHTVDLARWHLVQDNGSAQEHAIWEELVQTESISTVKSLQLAEQRGITIYEIEPYSPLPPVPDSVREDVRGYVNAGWKVTVPEEETPLNQWEGVGYIAERFDGATWQADYMINGELAEGGRQTGRGGYITTIVVLLARPVMSLYQKYVGDPINTANGNVTHSETDVELPGAGPDLLFARNYNSQVTSDVGFGPGWTHSYSDFLTAHPDGSVTWADSRGVQFTFAPDGGGGYITPDTLHGGVLTESGGVHTYRAKDGLTHTFDAMGRLTEIRDRNGNALAITYDGSGRIEAVIDGNAPDRDLTFAHSGDLITSLSDFTGRTWTYGNAGGRLTSVTTPSDSETPAYTTQYDYYTDTAREGLLRQIALPDGGAVQYAYYPNRRGFEVTDPEGHAQRVYYYQYRNRARFVDARGHQTVYDYNDRGNLEWQVHPDGARESWVWQDNLTMSHTDPFGLTERYDYDFDHDRRGNLTERVDRAGHLTTFTYDPDFSQMTKAVDELGRVRLRDIDPANGNVLSDRYVVGEPDPTSGETDDIVTYYTYTPEGLVDTVTDPRGHVTDYDYEDPEAIGLSSSITFAVGTADEASQAFEYDARGNRTAFIDERSYRTEYAYDALDRLLRTIDATGSITSRTYAPLAGPACETHYPSGRTTFFEYDRNERLVRTVDAENGVWEREYDANGNLVAEQDALGRVVRHQYDARNREVARTLPDGAVERVQYDGGSGMLATVDALGHVTTFTYDVLGRLRTVTDPLGNTTERTYDAVGNLRTAADARGSTTTYEVDRMDRLERIEDPLGRASTGEYDPTGNLTATVDPVGRRVDFTYDAQDRRLTETDGLSHTTRWEYDPAGNVIRITDPLGHRTEYTYDKLNRNETVTDAEGGVAAFSYDAVGNLISLTDPEGNTTSYTYDGLGRRLTETNQLGHGRTTAYDAAGNPVSTTDRNGRVRQFVYDQRDRMVAEVWLNEADEPIRTISMAYDAAGRLTDLTDPDTAYRYDYDAAGRVETFDPGLRIYTAFADRQEHEGRLELGDYTRENRYLDVYYADVEVGELVTVTMTSTDFSPAFYLVMPSFLGWHVTSGGGTTASFQVTAQERGQWQIWAVSESEWATGDYEIDITVGEDEFDEVVLTYTYDANGNVLSVTDGIGGTTAYEYDLLDRVERVTQSGGGVAEKRVDFAYADQPMAHTQTHTLTRYADLAGTQFVAASEYHYDLVGRLDALTHARGATVLADYTWDFDDDNLITRMTSPDGVSSFGYDDTHQLIGADHDYQPDEAYVYDSNGNRDSEGYETAEANRLTSDGTYTYEYDAEGNLIRRTHTVGGAVRELEWDHHNRLVKVTDRPAGGAAPAMEAEYGYDSFGRRVRRSVDGDGAGPAGADVETFVYDGDHIAMAFDTQGQLAHRYLHGPTIDQILAEDDADGTVLWALTDHQGTVRDLVTSAGAAVNHIQYDSFGQMTSQTNPAADFRFTYTGREFDAETGLYYCRARYYDPVNGRFLGEDPMRFAAGDANLYRYVMNQPTVSVDPLGLCGGDPDDPGRRSRPHPKSSLDIFCDALTGLAFGWWTHWGGGWLSGGVWRVQLHPPLGDTTVQPLNKYDRLFRIHDIESYVERNYVPDTTKTYPLGNGENYTYTATGDVDEPNRKVIEAVRRQVRRDVADLKRSLIQIFHDVTQGVADAVEYLYWYGPYM